ncbi:MAG: LysR family transcriptional regulator [Parvibaculum sp.]|uniref:LysR family transcriptional regulator n=1 Tax=Parvibaculum sp. TaxID=2024848 RepID=UPI0027179B1A|nr:LysR family transcriptional regulator [Parvibaculum sp.]MDO8839270.1 LysR family transcriptional regulator [Parvibaculum sp.]
MTDLNGFAVFARVVELGGFTAAAEALGLSKSVVSRQVSALEDQLGVRLLNRTTRRVAVTEAGALVFERANRIVAEAEEAAAEANCVEGQVRGRLRVNAPMSFGIRELGPVLPAFLARYPDLDIDLVLNDRRVDLIEEGFDVSLRISELEDSSLIARQLAPVERFIVGAPAYFEKQGQPERPADLATHPFMLYTLLAKPGQMTFTRSTGQRETAEVKGRFFCNNADAMLPLMRAGSALCLAPDFICHEDLRAGRLVRALDDWSMPPLTLHVIYPHARHLSAKVRAFVDFAVEHFGPGKARWEGVAQSVSSSAG